MRWIWLVCSRVSCLRARSSERSSWISSSGTKLALIRPQATKSAIHMASLTSVLRPNVLDVCRIGHDQLEFAVAQDVPDRLPIESGRLHRHIGAPRLRQPQPSKALRPAVVVSNVRQAHQTTEARRLPLY